MKALSIFALALSPLVIGPARADSRPILVVTFEGWDAGQHGATVRQSNGRSLNVALIAGAWLRNGARAVTASAFRKGTKVAVRVAGSMAQSPLPIDLICDPASAELYRGKPAGGPNTPIGELPSSGGAPKGCSL